MIKFIMNTDLEKLKGRFQNKFNNIDFSLLNFVPEVNEPFGQAQRFDFTFNGEFFAAKVKIDKRGARVRAIRLGRVVA